MSLFYDEIVYAQNVRAEARKAQLKSGLSLVALSAGASLVGVLAGFEISIAFTLMDDIYGPELPGEPTPLNVVLMAGATIVGVIGYEVLKAHKPEHKALKLLEQAAYIVLPIFFGGMVMMFAMSDIAAAPANSDAVLSDANLFAPQQDNGSSFSSILDAFGSFALGTLVILNLVVISKLVETIRAQFPGAFSRWKKASAIIASAKRFLTGAERLALAKQDIARLDHQFTDDLNIKAAGEIEAAAAPTLRALRKLEARQAGKAAAPEKLLARHDQKLPHPLPDKALISAFVKALVAKLARLPDQFGNFLTRTQNPKNGD